MALVTYLDGARKLLNQYVIAAGDATGAQSLSIDVSALAKNNGKECTHVSLNKVYFNVQVNDYDFSSVGGISPTTADKAASGYTGDVTIVNPARAAGDTIFIKMEWIKHYAN